ncbi:helix-turn-helix domain-containing protein, partial [Rhodopseudomonas parapalustris]
SKLSGIAASTISQIESGKRQSLYSENVEKIAAALGVTTNVLYATEENVEYIANDIDQLMHMILESDELSLDDIVLSNSEKEQFKMAIDIALNSIRNQRK